MIGETLEFRMEISGISNVYINLLRSKGQVGLCFISTIIIEREYDGIQS